MRASLQSPQLIGESGYRRRYLKLQWWVVLWRMLILVQIPEVLVVRPAAFTRPLAFVLLMLLLAVGYTFFHYWLATRSPLSGRACLHAIDLTACASLMLLADNEKLIFIMMFFSFSCLLARPTTLLRQILPSTVLLAIAYICAVWIAGQEPWTMLSRANEMGSIALFFFWGVGFVGFAAIIEQSAALELDSHLQEQRRQYRRQLHDDLGNTLCGLHFRIQGLKKQGRFQAGQAFAFLSDGYQRANRVLEQLLAGIDQQVSGDLANSLRQLRTEAAGNGLDLRLELPEHPIELSAEAHREILAIVREAVTNIERHAGVAEAKVGASTRRGRLVVQVSDRGRGFEPAEVRERQEKGSMGLNSMAERARIAGGELTARSGPEGTTLTVEIKAGGQSRLVGRMLEFGEHGASMGIYRYLIRLRGAMFVWTMIQLYLQPASRTFSVALLASVTGLLADCLAWIVLRRPLYGLVSRHPWTLVIEQLALAGLAYVTIHAGLPLYFTLYMGVSIIMNALFLGSAGNLAVTAVFNAALLLVQAFSPSLLPGATGRAAFEPMLQHVTIFFILALTAGLAGEFVLGLQRLQASAIGYALARQRERLSAETHRQLHSLVKRIGEEVAGLKQPLAEPLGGQDYGPHEGLKAPAQRQVLDLQPAAGRLAALESASTDLKNRLRAILASLEAAGPRAERDGYGGRHGRRRQGTSRLAGQEAQGGLSA